ADELCVAPPAEPPQPLERLVGQLEMTGCGPAPRRPNGGPVPGRRSAFPQQRAGSRPWPAGYDSAVADPSSTGGEAIAPVPLRYRTPNALARGRLLVLPVFWVVLWRAENGHSVLAFVLFGLASITDYLDGYLARRFHHSTRFGRLADPLADRLLI